MIRRKDFKRKRAGLSSLMATIIITAVTLAVLIPASLWSGGLTAAFTRHERIEVKHAYVVSRGGKYVVNLEYVNTGSSSASIDTIMINDVPYSKFTPAVSLGGSLNSTELICETGETKSGSITISPGAMDPNGNELSAGGTLSITLHTSGGTSTSTVVVIDGPAKGSNETVIIYSNQSDTPPINRTKGVDGLDPVNVTSPDNGTVVVKPFSGRGVNYLSLYHLYSTKYTTNEILRSDFSRFKQDGINVISLSLYWYRLEGNVRGSYDGSDAKMGPYGDRFLDDVKRVIGVAHEYGIEVLVTFHTLWGTDSSWCTPDYVIDPVSGKNIGLAIVRSEEMKGAFVDMVNHTVRYLAGTPGIWAWALLNEPWYWPHELDPPFDGINQNEGFIDLIQRLSTVVKESDGRPTTIRFASSSNGTNIFVDDWGWDQRIFDALDFISFNAYMTIHPELVNAWMNITSTNVIGCVNRGKRVWVTEFGYKSDDDTLQSSHIRQTVEFYTTLPIDGWIAWYWRSDAAPAGWQENPGQIGKGMDLCASADGTPRPAYYDIIRYTPRG
jgi:hypothetical protein